MTNEEMPKTENEYILSVGENLPNHSTALVGRRKFVRQSVPSMPVFRTRQQAYRFAAWLVTLAEHLPNESDTETHDFDEVLAAVRG